MSQSACSICRLSWFDSTREIRISAQRGKYHRISAQRGKYHRISAQRGEYHHSAGEREASLLAMATCAGCSDKFYKTITKFYEHNKESLKFFRDDTQ